MQFEDLRITAPIIKALKEEKYTKPTSIQEKTIPLILNGYDVLASAQTGTGKTAAFAIPILQHIFLDHRQGKKSNKINTLILTPTRELAIQVAESFTVYGKHTGIKNTAVFGGVKQRAQTNELQRNINVLVATPGRLLDLMNQGFISLSHVKYFVLDEADKMLDMGFIHDIKKIISKLPVKRQSLFFSATMPKNIIELSRAILTNPQKIKADLTQPTAKTIQQYLYYTNKSTKKELLYHILQKQQIDQVLLFSKTKHGADKITRSLQNQNIKTAAIHGNKTQGQRQKALTQFKTGKIRALVATDIAARGIDIDKLKYVINYDIPNIPETYVHRIGRSGRAGENGTAISICSSEDNAFIRSIEKFINQKIQLVVENPFPQTEKPTKEVKRKEWRKKKGKKVFFSSQKRHAIKA